jgi:hypothetical protein
MWITASHRSSGLNQHSKLSDTRQLNPSGASDARATAVASSGMWSTSRTTGHVALVLSCSVPLALGTVLVLCFILRYFCFLTFLNSGHIHGFSGWRTFWLLMNWIRAIYILHTGSDNGDTFNSPINPECRWM